MNIIGSWKTHRAQQDGADDVHILQEVYNTGARRPLRTEPPRHQFQPGAGLLDAPTMPTTRWSRTAVARTHPVRSVPLGNALPERLESRGESGVYPHMDGLRLPPGPPQRHNEYHDPSGGARSTRSCQAGGRRIFRRRKWFFPASLSAHQHFVKSVDKNIILPAGRQQAKGKGQARAKASSMIKGRIELDRVRVGCWRPTERTGMSVVAGTDVRNRVLSIPLADYLLSKRGNIVAGKACVAQLPFPMLNDPISPWRKY